VSIEQAMPLLARRAESDPRFMGWILARYCQMEKLSMNDLTRILACTKETVDRLCICFRPRAENFSSGIRLLAEKFILSPIALAQIVRHVDATAAISEKGPSKQSMDGLLMAARPKKHLHKKPRDKGGKST